MTITAGVTLESVRARTDRELIRIINGALERGFDLLRRRADGDTAGQDRAKAERAYAEATKLLPVVYGLSGSERRRLESRVAELRRLLDAASRVRG